jgi:hypothetical protein
VSNCRDVAQVRLRWLWLAAALAVAGCSGGKLPTAPVEGKVLYKGKPLEFGAVLFQADAGPPARGTIQADGTFRLSTYGAGDGAVLGVHRVQITCFESQRPGVTVESKGEQGVGQSLIPAKYTRYDSSGLRREVGKQNEPFVFELTDE